MKCKKKARGSYFVRISNMAIDPTFKKTLRAKSRKTIVKPVSLKTWSNHFAHFSNFIMTP